MSLLQDARYAIRVWTRNPGFTAVAVLTIALGIGANTTMFSVVNATLLARLSFPEPDRLMTIWKGRIEEAEALNIISLQDYRYWLERSGSFESLALFDSAGRGYNLTGQGEPEQVSGVRTTASFFDVLGVRPMLGRTFLPEEEDQGRDRVVVLSHGLWTRSYGADPGLVGRTVQIDGEARTVIGIMPPHFRFQFWSGPRQLWVPAGWTEGDRSGESNSFIAIARLKPGVSLAAARAEMEVVGPADGADERYASWTARVVPLKEYGTEDLRQVMLALVGVVGFVLLIACVNVANLLLARAATRQRELAIRGALGAGRGRIVRQLLTESVLLGLLGGAGGLLLAVWGTSLLFPLLPDALRFMPLRPLDGIEVDTTVLAFTFSIALLSGVLFGLAPAFAAFRSDLNHPLKEQARGSTASRGRLRHALVASEVALTLVTLAGAGVMILSLVRLLGVDPGLDPRNVLVMSMSLPQENLYYGPPGNPRFCQQLDEQLGSHPGVLSTSAVAHLPLSGAGAGRTFSVEGRPNPGPDNQPGAAYSVACPNVLETLGIPLLAGREFTHRDAVGAPGVVLVNERLAKREWPDEDPIGQRFKLGAVDADTPWLTVVGVFSDIRHYGPASDPPPLFYRPYPQAGWPVMSIVTKTAAAPGAFVAPVKKALAGIEPDQPVSDVRTMEEVLGASVSGRRFPAMLLSGFALLALLLAAVGIAGVVGYSVVQRTKEIGVRMALGAGPADVQRLMVQHNMRWTLIGVGAGLIASVALLGVMRATIDDVEPANPIVLGAVSLLLIGVALAASYLPARRAARVDPIAALRQE